MNRDLQSLQHISLLLSSIFILLIVIFVVLAFRPSLPLGEEEKERLIFESEQYTYLKKGWHEIDFERFSIQTPSSFVFFKTEESEEYVGILTDKKDTFYVDYGSYPKSYYEFGNRSKDTINGIAAVSFFEPQKGVGIYFQGAGLSLFSHNIEKNKAFEIFKTLKLPNKSGVTTDTLGQNLGGDLAKGEWLFDNNCSSCHDLTDQVVVGPGLYKVSERMDKTWFKSWVNNPDSLIQNNPKARELFEQYNQTRSIDFDFTDDEIDMLFEYLSVDRPLFYEVVPIIISCP